MQMNEHRKQADEIATGLVGVMREYLSRHSIDEGRIYLVQDAEGMHHQGSFKVILHVDAPNEVLVADKLMEPPIKTLKPQGYIRPGVYVTEVDLTEYVDASRKVFEDFGGKR